MLETLCKGLQLVVNKIRDKCWGKIVYIIKEWLSLRRTDHEAILASGQPTCTSCRRSYRRQESEAVEKEETLKRRMPESDEIGAVYRKLRLCLGLFEHASKNDEAEEEDEEKRHRLRWCRRGFRRIVEVATRALLLGIALLVTPGKYFYPPSASRKHFIS